MTSLLDLIEPPAPAPIDRSLPIEQRFEEWVAAHPQVVAFVTRRALSAARNGCRRLSTKHLLEEARASSLMTVEGKRDFKIDNTYSGLLARRLMDRHPELDGLFEVRRRRSES